MLGGERNQVNGVRDLTTNFKAFPDRLKNVIESLPTFLAVIFGGLDAILPHI